MTREIAFRAYGIIERRNQNTCKDSIDYQGFLGNNGARKTAFARKKSVEELVEKLATSGPFVTRQRQLKNTFSKERISFEQKKTMRQEFKNVQT